MLWCKSRAGELHRIRPSIISGLVPRFLWEEVKKNFLSRTGIAKATRTDRAALKMFHSKNIIQHLIGDVKWIAKEREVV